MSKKPKPIVEENEGEANEDEDGPAKSRKEENRRHDERAQNRERNKAYGGCALDEYFDTVICLWNWYQTMERTRANKLKNRHIDEKVQNWLERLP